MHTTIRSTDGTAIAVEDHGDGQPLVLVGGAFNDRSTMTALATELRAAADVRTVQYDRRGRGDSGPAPDRLTADERRAMELADLAAVLRHVGGSAAVFGHSSGGVLALEAAAAGLPVTRVAVYEPSYVVPGTRRAAPADLGEQIAGRVAEGDRDGAVALFLTGAVGMPEEFLAGVRQDPATWGGMTSLAHTLPNDLALHGPDQSPPDHLARIDVPVLVLDGDASPEWARVTAASVAAAVPGAAYRSLPGQDHAVLWAPTPLVGPLTQFLG